MNIDALKLEFLKYAERMAEIRKLSSPDIHAFDSAEDYTERLNFNFQRVGRLAALNREMLDSKLYPILDDSAPLDADLIEEMKKLNENLLNVADADNEFTNLDLPIASLISEKLLKDSRSNRTLCDQIRQMHEDIAVLYSLTSMTARIFTHPEISDVYRKKGVKLGIEFISLLDKDRFLQIDDMECREMVLTNARFMTVFFERVNDDPEINKQNIRILNRMYEVSKDPFYQAAVPGFDWIYFRYRILEYFVQSTEVLNARGFDDQQLEMIAGMADEFEALCRDQYDELCDIIGFKTVPVYIKRCRYLVKKTDKETYRSFLLSFYKRRDKNDFGVDGCYANILIPLELICLMDEESMSVEDMMLLKDMYQNILAYVFKMPSDGIMSYAMEFIMLIIRNYIEVPSGIHMKDFVLSIIAAIHPPTYIHSQMVGLITECLCRYLTDMRPELLIGIAGTKSAGEVIEQKDRIVAFAYNAALCHDFGKVNIIDTIFVYGRKLLDFEFNIIKSHPETGAQLLLHSIFTKEYADVALMHHKWYDDSKGYPVDKASATSPYKTIIDLVQCADCMDAATDTVGRSYNRGKTLADFMEELKEECGTRYAPWLLDLFDKKEVQRDIKYILEDCRKRKYKETFVLLRDVQERG